MITHLRELGGEMIEYKIVSDTDDENLEIQVNSMLEAGWKLQGGVSLAITESELWLAQALIWEVEDAV
jgi:hypothetical protein